MEMEMPQQMVAELIVQSLLDGLVRETHLMGTSVNVLKVVEEEL